MPLIPYSKINNRRYTVIINRYTSVNDGPDELTESSVKSRGYVDSFNGFKQPGWRSVIRAKANATTPASGTKNTFKDDFIHGDCSIQAPGQKVRRSSVGTLYSMIGDDLFLSLGSSAPPSEIDNRAVLGFLKKAKQAQRKLMALVVTGEARQTIELIKKPAVGLRNLVSQYVGACRRGVRGLSPRATLRHISNQWLEYSFGMVPLISDIDGALESALKIYKDVPSKYVVHKQQAPFEVQIDTIPGNLWSQFIPVLFNRISYRSLEIRLSGEVRLMTTGPHGPIAETIGLTLPDFIPSVYELIPYSFLLDYFVNLGEILEALSFNQADLIWHCKSSTEEARRTVEVVPAKPETLFGYPVVSYRVTPGIYTQSNSSYSRSSPPLGVPSLAVKIPDTWSKGLNIAGLAALRVL